MQENSDPLPYTQVDRAVKPKAALLAGAMGVSIQHALGSLVEFWDLCGDPRELEALIAAGLDEVVLTAPEIAGRFALASGGKGIDPVQLAALGLLEPRGDDFRVRGMSRYFQPLRRRVQAREAASAGGKATASKAHREGGKFAKRPVEVAGALAGPALERSLERSPSDDQAEHQATHQAATKREPAVEPTQRTEVSGQRSSLETTTTASSFKRILADPEEPSGAGFYAWAQQQRVQHGLIEEMRVPAHRTLSDWFSVSMMTLNGDLERLRAAYGRFTDNDYWAKADPPWPFHAFIKNSGDYVQVKRIA